METPDNSKPLPSALDNVGFIGVFPKKRDTVIAEVLKRLLMRDRISSLDAVYEASTTRLAGVIYRLRKEYEWDIQGTDEQVATRDGRVTEVSRYWLTSALIEKANSQGAKAYCGEVERAREALRKAPETLRRKGGARE